MYRHFQTNYKAAFLTSVLLLTVLAVTPLLISGSSEFLGRDVSGIASSIVAYYPWYFIREISKVLALVFFVLFFVSVIFHKVGQCFSIGRWYRIFVFPGIPILLVVLTICGSVYEYPALYDSISPLWMQKIIFKSAGLISPNFFRWVVCGVFLCGFLFLGVKDKPSHKFLAGTFILLAMVYGYELLPRNNVRSTYENSPNILLIAIDSLRSDHLDSEATPEIVGLLKENSTINFENHYIGVPRTFPSWVELLFARNAPSTSVRHMFPGFGDRRQVTKSLPMVLSENNYNTAVISDFAGDIFPRFESGFDIVRAPSMNLRGLIELAVHQKFPLFLPLTTVKPFSRLFPVLVQNPAFADPKRLADQFAELPYDFFKKPWFATIFFSTAHFPYAVPYPYYRKETDSLYGGPFYFQKNPEITGEEVLTEENIRQTRGLYKGALAAIDASIKDIFTQLKASGAWDNTVIVITADHGEDLYENGRLQGHGEHLLGHNVIKVPFILHVPGQNMERMSPITFVTRSIDVGPTIAGALGIDWKNTQGENLFSYLNGQTPEPQLVAYSETGIWFSATGKGDFQQHRLSYPGISGLLDFDHGMSQEIVLNPEYEKIVATAKHRSIVLGDFKLVYVPTEKEVRFYLFNERQDPENLQDLAQTELKQLDAMKELFFKTVLRLEPKSVLLGNYIVRQ